MERRKYKRYSGIPIRVLLKNEKDGQFHNVDLINISLGGILIRTNDRFMHIYDQYVLKIEIPVDTVHPLKNHDKDVIFARGIVWRIEADRENYKEDVAINFFYVALRFTQIDEHDRIVISEYLSNFEENVPYE
ncbi:MAG: PilZ domain-containing protein [Calditerrivibrio sp.]|nr:PilZ domain-containing protein [Calditerrivibrio sp.]